jgi:hypothetical protein
MLGVGNRLPATSTLELQHQVAVARMAYHPDRDVRRLDPATTAELRVVLGRSLRTGNHDGELKALLSRAAEEARERGLLAEQLLLSLKNVWHSLPQVSAQTGSDTQTRLLQQLVTRCIEEYYGH